MLTYQLVRRKNLRRIIIVLLLIVLASNYCYSNEVKNGNIEKFDIDFQIAYENAKQGVLIAQNNYDMLQNGSRYEDKLMATSQVKKAEGAKKEAQSYLNENVIIAPISGQITDVAVEEGELVEAGYTIISIVDVTDSWVVFNLREDLLRGMKVGTEFNVKIPAISNNNIRVRVNYISQMGNFATRRATKIRGDFDLKTFEVHAKPLTPLPDLRAGMSVITYINKK